MHMLLCRDQMSLVATQAHTPINMYTAIHLGNGKQEIGTGKWKWELKKKIESY